MAIHALVADNLGWYSLDLRLQRPSHDEALNDIFGAFQRLGWYVGEATVTEWVNAAAQGFVLVAFSCSAAGSTTQAARITGLAALFGALAPSDMKSTSVKCREHI